MNVVSEISYDPRALITVIAFAFVFFASLSWAMSYSQKQFVRQLRKKVNKDVKQLTENLEKELQIPLGSEDLPDDGSD